MAKSAIIKIGSFQYNIEEGMEYSVPKFEAEEGKTLEIKEVLFATNGKDVKIGKPLLDKATVSIKVLVQTKGDKVVSKIFKAKSRYRRTRGFRKQVTKFKVEEIKF